MKEKIQITIEDLDNIYGVLNSLELLFTKLIYYYAEKDLRNLNVLVLTCSVYFGQIFRMLGFDEDNLKEL